MKPIHILLVEDSEGDIVLITEALSEGRILNQLSVVRDGYEALMFLQQLPPYSDTPRPDLILLDINLPKKNGHEVLQFIKNHPDFKRIPVIMLTTSERSNVLKAKPPLCLSAESAEFVLAQLERVLSEGW